MIIIHILIITNVIQLHYTIPAILHSRIKYIDNIT